MAKVTYDVSNVDESGGFEHVQPGMYIGKITEINLKDSKSGNGPMLEVILQPVKTADGKTVKVKDKKKQIGRVYTYVLLEHEPSDWKLKEFTKAVGLKDKGMIDTDKLVGSQVQMNLKPDTDLDDKYRPKVGKLMAMPNGKADGAKAKAKAAPVQAVEDDDEDIEEYTAEDLAAMDDDELIEAADEFEIKKPAGKMNPVKKKKLIRAILEAQEEQDDEDGEQEPEDDNIDADADEASDEVEDDEEEDDTTDDEEEDDTTDDEDLEDTLGALDRKGLKEYIKEHDLDITVKKSMEDDDIREAITEALDAGSDEDESEQVDYTAWSMDALKKEAQERGLSTKGSKKILAGRLSKDDEDDDNPF
jgi:hypothetical protein